MTITAEDIHNDILANLGNRDDLAEARVYRTIHYSQLAIARLTKWRDMIRTFSFSHDDWGPPTFLNDTIVLSTTLGIVAKTIRSVMTFYLDDAGADKQTLLRRVASYHDWDKIRMPRTGNTKVLGSPTHYFFATKDRIELFPCPDAIYNYGIRLVLYPAEISVSTKTSTITVANCEDLVTARSSYIIAAGLNMKDIAMVWKAEYDGMLRDLYQAEKDVGDIDIAAFRQEINLNTSNWWNDPMSVNQPPNLPGDQVL